jgi:tetratricopeptide (TPR) repeat protein
MPALMPALMSALMPAAHAAPVEDAVAALQRDWEVIRYQLPSPERERRFEVLVTRAHKLSESFPGRSEPLVWEGIALGSLAIERGGFWAWILVRQAKAACERAVEIDGSVLGGAAYQCLGALYYKAPGWPIAFGDRAKARELLTKALELNPDGIDPNFFFGEFLVEGRHPEEALPYLERVLQTPPRPGRQIVDTGRKEEARALLARVRSP